MNAHRTKGVALITAMLVMVLSAIAAAAVLVSANTAIRRASTLIDGERAWWYVQGLESFGRRILATDLEKNGPIDSLDEDWHRAIDYLPVEQGVVRGSIEDLQGRFNLNNLASVQPAKYQQQLLRLFQNIEGLDAAQAQPLAEAIADWIDTNQIPSGAGGAEDTDYMSLAQPYRAANQPMSSPTELLAVKGMTPAIYQALAPFVCTLPIGTGRVATKINVNTAKVPVLLALSGSIDRGKIELFEQERETEPAKTVQELQTKGTLPADVTVELVDIKTQFFLMKTEAFIGSGRAALYSVIQRAGSGAPLVIARSLDTE
ncbi:MAG: type II secretion system minor pseudopilin GspK [Stagnimonas sp.]|nr:type II secretion system minor pseudopilin GspK [Stagnimonas sp.]